MQARYVLIYSDGSGVSRFADHSVALARGFAVPPAEPLFAADFMETAGCFWVGAPTEWKGDTAHPTPGRQIFVTVQGAYRITAGDGEIRDFPVGSVLLLEDVSGEGHSTRITSDEDCLVFAVRVPADE